MSKKESAIAKLLDKSFAKQCPLILITEIAIKRFNRPAP
jgi:hypothetical protein